MYSFKLLYSSEMPAIIPFLKLLAQDSTDQILESRLQEMFNQGYQCVGVFKQDKMIGLSGLWIIIKYLGKHIEPDNVIIHPDYRGVGVGKALMKWIYEYAASQGCIASELNCYVTNAAAQKFWANQGYRILGFHYQKTIHTNFNA